MDYTYHREVAGTVAEIAPRVKAALQQEGFGVLSEIDLAATLKVKTGVDLQPYLILGACNPPLAQRAVEAEPRIGVMLPCNVILRQVVQGAVDVAAINPAAPMAAIGNPALDQIATEVGERLKRVIAGL